VNDTSAPDSPAANSLDHARGAVLLTWILLILDPPGHPLSDVPIAVAAIIGLVVPRLTWNPYLWWLTAALCAIPVVDDWFGVDNHAFLRVYWTVAIAASASLHNSVASLSRSARQLIGLVFLFATIWKALLSPNFSDGRYLRFTFMTDSRFAEWSAVIGGLGSEEQDHNRVLVGDWLDDRDAVWNKELEEPERLRIAAQFSTYAILMLELSLAIAFLWPQPRGPSRYRDPLLLVFGATTYAIATVDGFGWLLCTMGLAQTGRDRPWLGWAYIGLFALILIYARLPWLGWLIALH
jgi:hypothetical protein